MKQIPSPPFWGGVRVKKWSPFFDSGARSPIFGHLKMPKVPIFRCPKMGLRAPESKTETTFSREHLPPKWWTRYLKCPTGRVFQCRVGSGRVLEKIPGSGSGSGRVGVLKIRSGIFGYLFYSRVIPGIPGIFG